MEAGQTDAPTRTGRAGTGGVSPGGGGETPVFGRHVAMSGMPPLDVSGRQVSKFEFMNGWFFYAPVYFQWAWKILQYGRTGLPMLANPQFPLGGMVNESKIEIFDEVQGEARSMLAPYAYFTRLPAESLEAARANLDADFKAAQAAMKRAGLTYPFVIKPDIGCRGAGVRRVRSDQELRDYIAEFTPGLSLIVQELVDMPGEAGIFYVRFPNDPDGFIFSLTLKYFPCVVGDGQSTLRDLIEADPRAKLLTRIYFPKLRSRLGDVIPAGENVRLTFTGSHSRGAIFRDGASYITPEMTAAVNRIAKSIPEFYFGRFDVRFDDLESVRRGEGFRIIEVNGASSEATHIWDRKFTLWQAWKVILTQFSHLWKVGYQNYRRGFKPITGPKLLWLLYKEKKTTGQYPQSE